MRRRPLAIAAGAVLALALAFVAGRSTGPPPPAAPASAPGAAQAARPDDAAAPVRPEPRPGEAGGPATAAGPVPGQPPPAGPSALRTPLPPDALARLRVEVGARLEATRPEDLARCWPRAGLPRGQARTTITYDLTFDPGGREIARGLSDDRLAPAGDLSRCLSRSPGAPLTIPPQGTWVSVRVAVTYP